MKDVPKENLEVKRDALETYGQVQLPKLYNIVGRSFGKNKKTKKNILITSYTYKTLIEAFRLLPRYHFNWLCICLAQGSIALLRGC